MRSIRYSGESSIWVEKLIDMITSEDCKHIMDAYREGSFTGWEEGLDGMRTYDMGLATLRHTPESGFELDMGRGWISVISIDWRFSTHIKVDGAELVIGRRDG